MGRKRRMSKEGLKGTRRRSRGTWCKGSEGKGKKEKGIKSVVGEAWRSEET